MDRIEREKETDRQTDRDRDTDRQRKKGRQIIITFITSFTYAVLTHTTKTLASNLTITCVNSNWESKRSGLTGDFDHLFLQLCSGKVSTRNDQTGEVSFLVSSSKDTDTLADDPCSGSLSQQSGPFITWLYALVPEVCGAVMLRHDLCHPSAWIRKDLIWIRRNQPVYGGDQNVVCRIRGGIHFDRKSSHRRTLEALAHSLSLLRVNQPKSVSRSMLFVREWKPVLVWELFLKTWTVVVWHLAKRENKLAVSGLHTTKKQAVWLDLSVVWNRWLTN